MSGHIVIVVPSTSDEAGAATLETLRARLAALPGVRSVTTSANVQPQPAPAFRSIDGRGIAIVVAVSTEANDDQIDRIIAETRNASTDMFGPAVRVEGSAVVDKALGATTERDLLRADAIAVPIFLALLALVLRTRRALWWGLASIIATIDGSLLLLGAASLLTDVSVFACDRRERRRSRHPRNASASLDQRKARRTTTPAPTRHSSSRRVHHERFPDAHARHDRDPCASAGRRSLNHRVRATTP